MRKVLQVLMDGPSMNLKFLRLLQSEQKKKTTFKTRMETRGWKIKKSLKAAYTILHDSPARRSNYQSVTGSSKVLLHSVKQDGWIANLWQIDSLNSGQIFKNLWSFG